MRSRSCGFFFLRRGGCGGTTRHSTWALTQLAHGFCLSQRTFLCWHKTHEWPRVSFITAGSGAGPLGGGGSGRGGGSERGCSEAMVFYGGVLLM